MTIYAAAITLFLVMDPIGNIPFFLSILRNVDERRRLRIIVREMIIALVVLIVFLFFGNYILRALQITEPALSIGGGIVLFLIALRMIFPAARNAAEDRFGEEPFIVPLAVPLIAGPSSMATVILLATQAPDRMLAWLGALLVAWLASSVVLVFADILRKRLGNRFLSAVERLMGMILITLSVQMLLSGFKEYVHSF
jgi:multiple antibiotic resistance protein